MDQKNIEKSEPFHKTVTKPKLLTHVRNEINELNRAQERL